MGMISVEEALDKILGYVRVLDTEDTPILDALGQVLAEDVYSGINIPPRDNSAMDGYAVRVADIRGATEPSPKILRVIDTVIAGSIPKCRVEPGTAVRIMTGAPVPDGADGVVRFEDTDENRRTQPVSEIGIFLGIEPELNIRRAGEDVAKGQLILRKGALISPSEVGMLASLGRASVKVVRRPRVAILATGNELEEIGEPLGVGKIYNSNSYSVAALLKYYGAIPLVLKIARDTEESMLERIQEALSADMLITTGGVSLGDYDIVKDILLKHGEIAFWTVRMKPGKPLAFGVLRGTRDDGTEVTIPHLGLPGNPVSSMITSELFVRPAISKMMGRKGLVRQTVTAELEEEVINTDGRRIFARAIVEKRGERYFAKLTGPQGSGILTSMSLANGLAIIPEDTDKMSAGETVSVMMLDWRDD